MKAVITGESDRVGVNLLDNRGTEHGFELSTAGEIEYWVQDGYADDPSNRTLVENEHANQACRYAKWHVYRELGHETLTPYENPDRIVAAMLALAESTAEGIAEQFGALRDRLASHYDDTPVSTPFERENPDATLVYQVDLYVTPDPTGSDASVLDQFCEAATGAASPESGEQLLAAVRTARELPQFELEAVSGVHYYREIDGDAETIRGDDPLDREPDARIDLLPVDPDEFSSLRELLITHLANQVRDRFVLMGCEPPEPFRRQGLGSYKGVVNQTVIDLYEEYYLPDTPSTPGTPPRHFRSDTMLVRAVRSRLGNGGFTSQ